jgi:hypothetical protein
MKSQSPTNKIRKYILGGILVLLLAGAGAAWLLFTSTYGDTASEKPAYTVHANELIAEFLANDSAATKKYAEQIITVKGRVSAIEQADTTINIKMEHPGGSYISFAFQQQDMEAVKQLKTGDSIAVKGSCNGGNYSSILEAEYITFKRCTLHQ